MYSLSILDILIIDFNCLITLKCVRDPCTHLMQRLLSREDEEGKGLKAIELDSDKPRSSAELGQ